ncbi:hypothetical protein ACFOWE_06640 [Planomonospora corallina]|uniref:Lipoprotein n=1 Tax=Planomonospora corallina TaxID=1806052 RepID=A0ABV8I1L5_9ACTN
MRALIAPAAVLAAVLAVVLAAGAAGCSSRPAPSFTPADLRAGASGAPGPSGTSAASGAPVSPEAAAPGTETVRAAPGVRVVVETPAGADPDTTAMVGLVRDYFTETLRSITTAGEDDAYLGLLEMDGSRQGYEWVHSFVDDGLSVRGTARLYAFTVRAVHGPGAELGLCVDMSGMRLMDARTGRARKAEPWMRRPYFQVAGVRRYDDGTRKIRNLLHSLPPGGSAEGCQK